MPTFFGFQTNPGVSYDDTWQLIAANDAIYSCPGSGSQNIQELSLYGYRSGNPVNIRLGVYSSNGLSLIAEGVAEVAVNTTPGWQGHMTQASVKAAGGSSPGVLVGGTSYKFCFTTDLGASSMRVSYGSGNIHYLSDADYTGGMPANLSSLTSTASEQFHMRCGVDPVAGLSIPVAMRTYRNRRN